MSHNLRELREAWRGSVPIIERRLQRLHEENAERKAIEEEETAQWIRGGGR